MNFTTRSHKNGDIILAEAQYSTLFEEIKNAIINISDQDIINKHNSKYAGKMSLSYAINDLLKERLCATGWTKESPIFQDEGFKESKWRLDFAKDKISIEVAFNHGEAIAWNLLKPVLASELNHVQKAIQTKAAVLICATSKLKKAGAFDSAVGEFEKICRYLIPLDRVLTVPMVIIGLEAPLTFKMIKNRTGNRNIGEIVAIERLTPIVLEGVRTI